MEPHFKESLLGAEELGDSKVKKIFLADVLLLGGLLAKENLNVKDISFCIRKRCPTEMKTIKNVSNSDVADRHRKGVKVGTKKGVTFGTLGCRFQ